MSKVVTIGLDGFNPDLVSQWRDDLPILSEMMREGVYGNIGSTVPPITPQAWTCAMTGVNPGHYGFWDFHYRNSYVYGEPELVDSEVVVGRANPLYKRLPEMGKKAAVINVPVTYPPQPIPGAYVVTSFLTPRLESGFTYPPELSEEVERVVGRYIIDASTRQENFRQMDKDRVLERIYAMDRQRFELVEYFVRNKGCDYVFAVIMGTDRMPHLFYRYFDKQHYRYTPDPKYENALKDHYRFCDEHLGEVRDLLDDDTVLIVHSDHSVQRLDGRINLNEWLIQEGYMKVRHRPKGLVPFREVVIDWPETKAWATGYTGQLYLNVKGREPMGMVEPQDYDSLLDELGDKLKSIPDRNGKKMKTEVFKRKDIHWGPYADFGPDLFIYFDECRWNISEMIGYDSIYSYDTSMGPDDGGHGPEGFFVMAGPGIPKLGEINDFSLVDVAPTVLRIMGLEVPEDMEGRVLTEG